MSLLARAAVLVAAVVIATGCIDGTDGRPTVTVFAAASLTDALAEIGDAFEESQADAGAEVTVQFSFAGSSSLREQIRAGAPADVFVPADPADIETLAGAGRVEASTPIATNRLAIAVPAGNQAGVQGIDAFGDRSLLIGVCAPQVPCGRLAAAVFETAGVEPAPDTEEPDVRALLTKVAAGDLDAGLVYATDVVAAGDRVEGIDLPAQLSATTMYVAAVLDTAADVELADAFVAFLAGDIGQRILRDRGFGPT